MPEQNDANIAEVVTPSGVVEAAPTADVSQVVQGKGEQPTGDVTPDAAAAPAGQQAEQGPVPYDRFKEVNDTKNTLESENQQLREHLSLLGNQPSAPQPQQAQQESLTVQVMKQQGIDPELATPLEILQVFDAVSQIRTQQATTQNQAQQFVTANADYAEVVGLTDASGRFTPAPPLLRAMQKDPQLAADLQAAGAGASRLAYKIAVNDPTYQQMVAERNKSVPQVAGEAAAQAIQAASKLTSLSSVGNSGVIDKAAQMRAMSPEEHHAHVDKVIKQGGGVLM